MRIHHIEWPRPAIECLEHLDNIAAPEIVFRIVTIGLEQAGAVPSQGHAAQHVFRATVAAGGYDVPRFSILVKQPGNMPAATGKFELDAVVVRKVIERLYQMCCDVVDAHDPASGKNAPVPTATQLGLDIAALVALIGVIEARRKAQAASRNP